MNRRAFLFASLVAPAVSIPSWAALPVEVIYVGGWDCPYCIMWKNEYKAAWVASPEFKRVTWVEIEPPSLREAYRERFWPGELRNVLEQIPRKNGTPRFLIVQDGRIVFNGLGVNEWPGVVARLDKLSG
jgi:hypothetical protein